jgi:hypothetical protein
MDLLPPPAATPAKGVRGARAPTRRGLRRAGPLNLRSRWPNSGPGAHHRVGKPDGLPVMFWFVADYHRIVLTFWYQGARNSGRYPGSRGCPALGTE